MPVKLPQLPETVRDAFLEGLGDFLSRKPDLRRAILDSPEAILGIPLYRLDSANLRAGDGPEASSLVAWRLLAGTSEEGIAADVAQLTPRSRFAITSASISPNVPNLIELAKEVIHRSYPPNTDYELRLLRMKSAYLEVAWLKSNNSEPDLFIPVSSGIRAIARRETYDLAQLFARARATAERTTAFRLP